MIELNTAGITYFRYLKQLHLSPLKKLSVWVTISGTLCIWIIKFLIRPFVAVSPAFKPIIGIAPNLIGSFLLPFGACWFFQRIFRLQTQIDLTITCITGLLLVIINEYLQLIPLFGRTFDYLDILSSLVGVFLGHISFRRCMVRHAFATK